jgi:hypothetical protein
LAIKEEDTLEVLNTINCWDIIANSENFSGEELYNSIKAQLRLNRENK